MISLIIGALALIALGWLIIKGYNAKGVLFGMGILLLVIAFFMGKPIIKAPSGNLISDLNNYIYGLFESRGGNLGMIIMALIGFSAYMSHIGANDVIIRVLYKPLRYIRSPYLLMIGGYLIGSMMAFAIHSATALGVFLMATLFPIMTRLGISAPSAAAVCATTAILNLSPTAADIILAAEKANAELIGFSFGVILPMSLVAMVFVAVAHFFWQRFCDKQEGLIAQTSNQTINVENLNLNTNAPLFYFVLPFLPIIGLFIFNGEIAAKISLGGLIILTIILSAIIEFFRTFSAAKVYEGLEVCYKGMAEAFSAVVVLLVAAGIFAHSLSSIGFIEALIDSVQNVGNAATLMMFALVIITLLVAIASGSGNAAFFAFVEIAPKLAAQMGINPIYLIAPMMQVSNIGRAMSPVSGVTVAVAGAANLSPLLLAKRISVPSLVGVAVIVIYTMVLIPQ
ncbi:anaerobic C4-dicarboxylate transporter DcuC [Ursidibacter arcticus]|uniref:anaerobic C4-dicarboxylate transporter DcuC n=1 Tax=Ursidibacter arcticus TaxID=1524965 RepID=UPI0012FC2D93|nr:anaerobic C4-dicarboxylate transporter DcuC [Ursidibacter arcticus]KAE9532494.1 anaerobic C4-dicarboxylate transporter DcuC [Ursidibacter arcticus]